MPIPESILVQFSDALSGLAAGARNFLAEIRTKDGHRRTGVLWKPNVIVVSEQALPDAAEYEAHIADVSVSAHLVGRDKGTNLAVLRADKDVPGQLPPAAVPAVGSLALALGAGPNGTSVKLALVHAVGGAWQSLAGGTIDRRIMLDCRIGASEEGGPVLGADGGMLGLAARGPRRQSLVIPASTVERIVPVLLEKGGVERGWLGVSLHPVALPESLKPQESQGVGLMVMDVADGGPAAKAGVLAGDILLSAGGSAATRWHRIARQLGGHSIGQKMELTLARAGAIVRCEAVVETRKG